ncbi:MAG: DUF5663 domain-containing protein [bacterium]|nr:DUF5663 domain-containing protein [bacterium]
MDDNQTATQDAVPTSRALSIPSEVRSFLEGLLQDAGMNALDAEMKEEMMKELCARLDNFLTSTIIDNLPAENLDTFIQMNEEKKPKSEIEQFLKEHMPNTEDVFAKAFMEFRDLYLGNVSVARNAPKASDQAVKPAEA